MVSLIQSWLRGIDAGLGSSQRNFYLEFNDRSCIREWVKGSYMVAKLPKGSSGSPQWVNRNLTDDELAAYDAQPYSLLEKMDITTEMIESEYRFTLGWDKKGGCPICCIFAPDDTDDNAGLALSARDGDAETAWGLALFKHREIFEGKWPREAPSPKVRRG
jgi:hypothetical protein